MTSYWDSAEELLNELRQQAGTDAEFFSPQPALRALAWDVRERAQRFVRSRRPPLLAEEGFNYWCAVARQRTDRDWDAVILVTGPEGTGKSTLVLRMARQIDPTFSLERLVYTPEALVEQYEKVRPGEVVVWDEGVRGLFATDTFTETQKDVLKLFALCRAKRAIVFICIPNIWTAAKQLRQARAFLWIHVEARGRARVHERNDRLRYRPSDDLGFSLSETAPILLWSKFGEKGEEGRFYSAYLHVKDERMEDFLRETRESLARDREKLEKKRAVHRASDSGADDTEVQKILEARAAGVSYDELARRFRKAKRTLIALCRKADATADPGTMPAPRRRHANAAGRKNWTRGRSIGAAVHRLHEAQEQHPEAPRPDVPQRSRRKAP